MELGRQLRKRLSVVGLRLGTEWSGRAKDPSTVEALRWGALALTRIAIPLRMRLATNMKLAGVYRPALLEAYFERATDQLIMLAHILRAGFEKSTCQERFKLDRSFGLLEQAYNAGKGVINIAPHICGYPVYPAVISSRIPCSVYLRRNKDAHKMRITETVARAGRGQLVCPPQNASRAQRFKVAIDVLRKGKLLFITPDTPRKPQQGVAVTIFGRTAYFPTGVFVMSMRTGAPVVPMVWHWERGAYHIRYGQPIELARGGRIKQQAQRATQKWAQSVDAFLHDYPEMWWNWLDKRWTNIIRGSA